MKWLFTMSTFLWFTIIKELQPECMSQAWILFSTLFSVPIIVTDTALEIEMRIKQWEIMLKYYIVVVKLPRHVQLCDPMDCSMLGLPVPHHHLEFAQVHVHWISDVVQPSHPLMPSSPSALNLSQHQGLPQWVVWPIYWSFRISPSSEYSGLISIKIDWFDLLAVQGTFRSLLQHHSSKASILWHSAFFKVQLS